MMAIARWITASAGRDAGDGRGELVCAPLPGDAFAPDERAALRQLATEVAAVRAAAGLRRAGA